MYFDIFLTTFGARSSYPVALFSFNWLISTSTSPSPLLDLKMLSCYLN